MERKAYFGRYLGVVGAPFPEIHLVERQRGQRGERVADEGAYLAIGAGHRQRHLVALDPPAGPVPLVARRAQLDAGRGAGLVQLREEGARLAARSQVLVERRELRRRLPASARTRGQVRARAGGESLLQQVVARFERLQREEEE